MKFVELSDVIAFAKKNGYNWQEDKEYPKEADVLTCLPSDEYDEVSSKDPETEDELNMLSFEYFESWDKDDVNGFCSSIINKIIVGKYMTENGLSELIILNVGDKMTNGKMTLTISHIDNSGVMFDNGYCPNLKELYLGWIAV